MKLNFKILTLFILGISMAFAQQGKKPIQKNVKPVSTKAKGTKPKAVEGIFAELETSKGKIIIELEYKKTPITVANFISLSEGTNTSVKDEFKGKRFYDGLKFHRVIKDFMIQGGDPMGNGSGGPGYSFKDEFTDAKFDKAGILAMANSGPKTNGSQFFITHKDTPWLNGKHTIFGYVTTGQDVVNAIAQDDIINKITIVRKGADAKKFDATKIFSDYYVNKAEDDKKQAEIDAENRKKQAEIEAQKKLEYRQKYADVMAQKVTALTALKATTTKTTSGLDYIITQKGEGKKPTDGTTVYINYAGYLEDGSLFDSSYEEINKTYGKFDQNRANANGYAPFPFQYGNKGGLIPGFLEGIGLMSFGDKAVFFIPSNLGYGAQGAGNVIPPNSNIVFEVELLESAPKK